METALDRDALYYPYIHIRDVNWLKATLLSDIEQVQTSKKSFTFR